jgi:pimeloyl-ACP methyl ester carboxylesterase
MVVALLDREIPVSVLESRVSVGGLGLRVLRKGEGAPLLVLHDSLGNLGWTPLFERLSGSFSVVVPDLPGYGKSDRPDWARSPRDLGILVLQLLDRLGLASGVMVVGLGFGGFVGAEMACMDQSRFSGLVLVGATGLHAREGEVLDQMLIGFAEYGLTGFRDAGVFQELFGANELPPDVYELWDFGTEMTARVCWKPWMYSDQLPHLLAEVRLPALVVWGEQDRLVPVDVGRQYQELLGGRLEVVSGAGHFVDLEEPERLAGLVEGLAGSRQGGQG